MKTTRTVRLEILRHGPAHNQLLSKLTDYLALCGHHEAATIRVPFDHVDFQLHQRALVYSGNAEERPVHLTQVATAVGQMLGTVPGLAADLAITRDSPPGLTHLRLLFSASELALVPFELATSPPGFPGAGGPLSLQLHAPVSMTRSVRSAPLRHVWPSQPKILFAIAQPKGGLEPWLVDAHMTALARALQPWGDVADRGPSTRRLSDMLTVIQDASYRSIEEACTRTEFTHVHILAHGDWFDVFGGRHFGLALHPGFGSSEPDILSGERLASALRVHHRMTAEGLSSPKVVTLAACDSGRYEHLLIPGASVAHALHEAGVPLVIGSQFPLSKPGSVVLTEGLYSRLLWGDDPRVIIHDVRQRLLGHDRTIHDWGSVVAYASLPDDIDDQLREVRAERAMGAMQVSLLRAEEALPWIRDVNGTSTERGDAGAVAPAAIAEARAEPSTARSPSEEIADFTTVMKSLEHAIGRVDELGVSLDDETRRRLRNRFDVLVMTAAVQKRKAEFLWRMSQRKDLGPVAPSNEAPIDLQGYERESRRALERSLIDYRQAYDLDRSSHWAGMAYFTMKRVVDGEVDPNVWHAVRYQVDRELKSRERRTQRVEYAWALSALLHLWFHAWARDAREGDPLEWARRDLVSDRPGLDRGFDPTYGRWKLERLALDIVRLDGPDREVVSSTRRELARFVSWWKDKLSEHHADLAKDLLEVIDGQRVPADTPPTPALLAPRLA